MKKRSMYCMFLFLLIMSCVGCNYNTEISNYSSNKYIVNNPVITDDDYWGQDMFPDIIIDTTGEYIDAVIEKNQYTMVDTSISVTLSCSKKGTGFYFYGMPAIERLEEDKWIRLGYDEADPAREQWCICAIEGAENINFSTKLTVDIDHISDELTEGQYRMVIFFTDRILYVPFDMIGGNK